MHTITELIQKINTAVEDIQYNTEPKKLYDPIRYILSIGGKRIRLILHLMQHEGYATPVLHQVKVIVSSKEKCLCLVSRFFRLVHLRCVYTVKNGIDT